MATAIELAEQLQAAVAAGDIAEIRRITPQLEAAAKAPSFTDAWNYANKPQAPAAGGFESVWQFTKEG